MKTPTNPTILSSRQFSPILFTVICLAMALSGCSAIRSPAEDTADFPTQPITIIVGYAEGGGSDRWARSIGQAAESALGVPVEVTNIVGDGGLDALNAFQETPADGYTLFNLIDTYAAAYASGESDVDPGQDMAPLLVGSIAISQIYIAADDERYSTWEEIVLYAKENPGLTVSSVGTPLDLEDISIMNLEHSFGVDLERLIIEDAQERFVSPVTGSADLLIEQTSDVKDLVDSGQLKPVLTLWNERIRDSEDVPAVNELDADFVPLLRFRGLAAHKETDPARLEFLEAAFREAFNSEEFQASLRAGDLDIVTYPEDPVAAVQQQVKTYEEFNDNLDAD